MTIPRRRQQERRETTRQVLLDSATRLFGERGYAATSLEDVARECGLTIGAIYHHFGNKKALFSAVNEAAEQRIIDEAISIDDQAEPTLVQLRRRWQAFLELCDDPAFRRIVLVDSPNVLGRDRWSTSAVNLQLEALIGSGDGDHALRNLSLRMLRGAMAEAALALADTTSSSRERALINAVIEQLLTAIAGALDNTATTASINQTEER
jgi:AcrR family transcriptional regulator